jgi:hypothetical protein
MMSEQKSPIPQAAEASALSDESLETVSGGLSLISGDPSILITRPPVMPLEPTIDPLVLDPSILICTDTGTGGL